MINKKGQVGKIITIFPILFLVFVLMGIFVFACSAVSIANGVETASSTFDERIVMQEDLMAKIISVDFEDGAGLENMTVIDAIKYWRDMGSSTRRSAIKAGLEKVISNSENDYLFIFLGYDVSAARGSDVVAEMVYDSRDHKSIEVYSAQGSDKIYALYRGLVRRTSFMVSEEGVEKRVYLDYYWGKSFG